MKRVLLAATVFVVLGAIALPASAKVEFSYGGLFRARVLSQGDFTRLPDFVDTQTVRDVSEDTRNRVDQRLRLFFTFTASENLKLVTKFEANEIWGDSTTGGKIGADHPQDFVVKNSYIDFNIPNPVLPINAKVGIQALDFLGSWIIDDDFSAAVLSMKLDPIKVKVGYIGGQNSDAFDEQENIDDWFLAIDYVCGPFSASLVGFYQFGHSTVVSADPSTLDTPVSASIPTRVPASDTFGTELARNFFQRSFAAAGASFVTPSDNNLVDLGLSLNFKVDWMSAYMNFVKNLGNVEFLLVSDQTPDRTVTLDYEGWMIDAGASYFCGPFTFNLGGFYTSGPDDLADGLRGSRRPGDITWFTYPMATSKYFSEIIGGGIFDNTAPLHEDFQWTGYGFPSNLWTVNAGASWQALPSTKLAFSYYYFGTAEEVVSGPRHTQNFQSQNAFLTAFFNRELGPNDVTWDSEIGHELNLNLTHKIVDDLVLDLVAAYLFSGDAYSMRRNDNDAMEFGAQLQWEF